MDESKPWAGAELPCSEADRLLFNSSTKVTIGDGAKARFWHSSWLDGEAPKYLAPHLFDLVRCKNKSVQQELHNYSWIRSLRGRITSAVQVEEFVSLWIRLQSIQLTPGVRDSIIWRWTADASYSTRSAYRIQFQGSYDGFRSELIWKAHAENKGKVFAWIMVREKVLTADNLQKRGWPHQDQCALCNGPFFSRTCAACISLSKGQECYNKSRRQ